jgi:hypothetical protein
MIPSLQSRFKGAIIGALIAQYQLNNNQKINDYSWDNSPYLHFTIAGLKSIINQKQFDLKSWQLNLANTGYFWEKKQKCSSSQTAIITLPICLFCYENFTELKENLLEVIKLCQNPDLPSENVLIWANVIKMILDNKFQPNYFIEQIIINLEIKESYLVNLLTQIQVFIREKTPLFVVSSYLQRNCESNFQGIAQSFYGFATLPNNFSLGVQRAMQTTCQPELTTILTAILLGLYLGYDHLPLIDLLGVKQLSLGKELEKLSDELFAIWGGCYSTQRILPSNPWEAVDIIQRRKGNRE